MVCRVLQAICCLSRELYYSKLMLEFKTYTANVSRSFPTYVETQTVFTQPTSNNFQGVSDYVAGPVMCSASTIYSSLKESDLKPGQWAVFPGGGGGVGIQGVQLAAAMGMRPIVVDTGEERRKLALHLGAEHFIDFKDDDPVKKVLEITEGGAHGVIVTGVYL